MYNKKYKHIECDVCHNVVEEAETCLIFEEPQKDGKEGRTFHICDPETQSDQERAVELCISEAFLKGGIEDFKRYNFRRVFFGSFD